MTARNFRRELYSEYKANRRKPAKPKVNVRTCAIDGGWRTYVSDDKQLPTIAHIFNIASHAHNQDDATVLHLGAIAWAKSQGWRIGEQEIFSKEESVKRHLEGLPAQIRLYEPFWAPDAVPAFKVPEDSDTWIGGAG